MSCCSSENAIVVVKGNDTNWNNQSFLTINFTTDVLDLENFTATFTLCGIVKTFTDLSSGSIEVNYTSQETAAIPFGKHNGVLKLIDNSHRIATIESLVPFDFISIVHGNAIATQPYTMNFDVKEGDQNILNVALEVGFSIEIGETTTLPAGSDATVTNSGSPSHMILNFGIPEGIQGEQGEQGPQGEQGIPGEDGEDGKDGADAKINGVNSLTITTSNGIGSSQTGTVFNIDGQSLQDQIDNLNARGRFLALWNCATGLAESNPPESPYEYKTGDYFIVGTVASGSGTNYRPNGTSYTTGVASTTVETAEVSVDDVYYYDGTNWRLQNNTQKTLAFVNIAGSPYDNTNLANALNSKVSTTTTVNGKALSTNITLGTDDIEAGDYGVSLTYFVDFFVNANNSFGECIGGVFDDEGTFSKASYQTASGWNLNNISDSYTIVEAVGWCDRSIGKISTLTTTVKTDLVSAVNEVNSGLNNKASTSLDNLSANGQMIIDSQNGTISNCILEIPQDINLTLSSGTLTLSSGSILTFGDGSQYQLASNKTSTNGWGGADEEQLIFYRKSEGDILVFPKAYCFSGTTAPTSFLSGTRAIWYDTTNSIIKWTQDAGVTWTSEFSFPLGIIRETSGNVYSSLDQVFNGFGYIGSSIFGLPGVKVLIPLGRNSDGTLKSTLFTSSAIGVFNVTSARNNANICLINSNHLGISNLYDYNAETNYVYNTSTKANYTDRILVGRASATSSGTITSMTTYNPVRMVTTEMLDELRPKIDGAIQGVQVAGTELTPDVNNKVNIPKAGSDLGVAKINTVYGIGITANGELRTSAATDAEIESKSNTAKPLVPSVLNKAVMEGLGNNSLTWTEAYKTSARNTIGAGDGNKTIIREWVG